MGQAVADDATEKKSRKRIPEWRMYGDPRNIDGHFRPKKNLKTLLGKGKKWTRTSLAEAMGLKDPSVISKWINGQRYMRDEDVVRCSMAAGVSVTWILDLANNPGAEAWPNEVHLERKRMLAMMERISDGKTVGELARDYHYVVGIIEGFDKDIDEFCLKRSGCKTMEEFEEMRHDEVDWQFYDHIYEEANYYVQAEPWYVMVEDEWTPPHMEEISFGLLQQRIGEIESSFPGDHRNPTHLAHAMLDQVMKNYPAKGLESLTDLINHASRMLHQS